MKCLRCSGKMYYNSDGHIWECDMCGLTIDDLTYRVRDNNTIKRPEKVETGWICPKCGRGVAPWQSYCDCNNNYQYKIGFDCGESL